jgi:hypothetical protein
MKHGSLLLIVVAASLVLSGSAFATAPPDNPTTRVFTQEQLVKIEDNLLLCLASECPGVRATAALTIKQLKETAPGYSFERSIIPLMRIVKNEDSDDCSRLTASLALHVLESARGDYAIKMTAYFTEAGRVKRMCENLSYTRTTEKLALQ